MSGEAGSYEPRPAEVASWLASHSWTRLSQREGREGRAVLWARDEREILQPTIQDASDYTLRMDDLLRWLSIVNERPAESLALEMVSEGSDVSEWRAQGARDRDASVALEDGYALVQAVRNAVVATANSAVQRRGYIGHGSLKVAREHAQVVRMGQTQRGSYIVPVISRVPGALDLADEAQAELALDVSAQPFERRAMAQLADGLLAISEMVRASDEPSHRVLNESVGRGVSHELCSAVASLLRAKGLGDIDVSFNWARRLLGPRVRRVELPSQSAPIIQRMADALQGSEVIGEQSITGLVWQLKRDPGEDEGTIKVRADVGRNRRTISMVLNADQMHEAHMAADENRPVLVRGRLRRKPGRTWSFEEVAEFGIYDIARFPNGEGEVASDVE